MNLKPNRQGPREFAGSDAAARDMAQQGLIFSSQFLAIVVDVEGPSWYASGYQKTIQEA